MRTLLLSTVSVAALLTLAACDDKSADATDKINNPAVEESADANAAVPSTGGAGAAVATAPAEQPQTDMTAQSDTTTMPQAGDTATTGTVQADSIEKARLAVVNAKSAVASGAKDQALESIDEANAAIENVEQAADARQALDDARGAVEDGQYEEASAKLTDAEKALQEANQQASATMPTSGETTASTGQ